VTDELVVSNRVTYAPFVRFKSGSYQLSNMATNARKLGFGVLLLAVSAVMILGTGLMNAPLPDPLAAVAALGLAAGSLLVGLSERNAGV